MAARFTPITLEQFATASLPNGKTFKEVWQKGVEGNEIVFYCAHHKDARFEVAIYSSLTSSGECREIGQDAVRVMLYVHLDDNRRLPMNPKDPKTGKRAALRVFRTGGHQAIVERALKHARELYARASYLIQKNAF